MTIPRVVLQPHTQKVLAIPPSLCPLSLESQESASLLPAALALSKHHHTPKAPTRLPGPSPRAAEQPIWRFAGTVGHLALQKTRC